ncbi:MAG TPA: CocE/NonD family hydrolase, partial [Gillisia sp.]|nr:CocE/NonD family hydrolase [Gillisia sp.]
PRVQYYTMGSNKWQAAEIWPPAKAKMTTYYLNSDGNANAVSNGKLSTKKPGNRSQADSFTYDPKDPVPSLGGNVCCTGNAVQGGAYDQQEQEKREDILVYTTEPLKEGVEISGFIETTLYVSSDARDTDFTVKLVDVHPDGKAFNLDETIQRVRYREGYDKEVFMEEGEVYELKLTPMSTSNFFKKGHSIRIEISSSNFPRFARNLNTGGDNYDETEGVIANNKVHHSGKHASFIKLPIVKN